MEASCFVSPTTGRALRQEDHALVADDGSRYPVINGVPRFCEIENYTASFGRQWNQFQTTQIDGEGIATNPSAIRLFAETGWKAGELARLDILEAGSGAGRFSRVLLEHTRANLFSIDYSSAVEANWRNNRDLAKGRFYLAQASIYEMPFPDERFDKVLCLGVLQHTPDFEAAVHALIRKAKRGGEIVVDFYPIRGWWTKVHAKYLLRPITRRLSQERLLRLIDRHADRLMRLSNGLDRVGMSMLRRFVPIVDFKHAMPEGLTGEQLREWVVLDTFDMFSPRFDNPQRIETVAEMFKRGGAEVRFAGYVDSGAGQAAVVRAVRL
jgi:SAM-dependent methyltransferase